MVTERLLKRSARYPPTMEKRMKGSEKRSPTCALMFSCCSVEMPAPMTRKRMKYFRALSLNAPWNWVRMRLQNPRCQGLDIEQILFEKPKTLKHKGHKEHK